MSEAPVILDVKGLRSGYGRVPILHGLDFAIHEGEIVGILGHNGMGKSTLLKTLMGLVPTTGGTITFDGVDVTHEPSHGPVPPRNWLRAAGARNFSDTFGA